ncbi:hypothetical protein [Aquimarina longa]|uniref:hypothetical protein n=1 Tax=Aquimarina longa TaxID=1080221 RepID=UPI0007803E19|nr:hypothetical protein [Aquimarina longa]
MKSSYITILIVLFSLVSYAQNYRGTIGKHEIFFQLDTDYNDDSVTAFYFYKSHLKNILLGGRRVKSELVIYEKYSDLKEKKELFTLQFDNDQLYGTWENMEVVLKVHLTKTTEDFRKYKLRKIKFLRDSVTVYDNKELVWFTEKYSKKTLFRLGNGFTSAQHEFVNQKLDTLHASFAEIGLECEWADIDIDVKLVSDDYISFYEYSSIYCGGAHPNHNKIGYNYDLKQNVQLEKINEVYPLLDHYTLLKNKYEKDTDLDIECEYFLGDGDLWTYYNWVFTKEGISIVPSYPHAMTPCEIDFLLTYKELEKGN